MSIFIIGNETEAWRHRARVTWQEEKLDLSASQVALVVKNLRGNAGDTGDVRSVPRLEEPSEEGMATHSSVLAWRIPQEEEPRGLQSMGLHWETLQMDPEPGKARGLSRGNPEEMLHKSDSNYPEGTTLWICPVSIFTCTFFLLINTWFHYFLSLCGDSL